MFNGIKSFLDIRKYDTIQFAIIYIFHPFITRLGHQITQLTLPPSHDQGHQDSCRADGRLFSERFALNR